MRQYFPLDSNEKKQEWLMITFAVLTILVIAKGVYNQFHKIDQDYLLMPLSLTTLALYFLFYGINGLTKGNLIPKWTPGYLFKFVVIVTKITVRKTPAKAGIVSTRLLGIFGLIISLVLFTLTIFFLTK